MLTSLTTYFFGGEYQKTIAIGLLILLLVVDRRGCSAPPRCGRYEAQPCPRQSSSAALLLFTALLPYITGNLYHLHLATLIGAYWVLIATLNLLVGFTGQLSVGHVGLLAIGAYCFCLLAGGQGWIPFVALLAGGAICAVLGLAPRPAVAAAARLLFRHGDPGLRLIVSELALAEQWLTNGSVGMPARAFPPRSTRRGAFTG